jgi:succinate dehydrogenase / fumarate reductase membrane anchor subunit
VDALMADKSPIADPTTHYGSPRKATRAFFLQRISGALNIVFLAFLIWLVVRLAGADRLDMIEVVARPWIALPLALLIVNVCIHMRIGMREIIEDYVHDPRINRLSLGANDIFVLFIALLGLGALVKIVFWG